MAYRIDFDKPLTDEVRRIAAEQLSAAFELLEKQPDTPHEAIHDARKHIKRTRALYRLIRSEARDFAASENDRLRAIAVELSRLRDATAMVECAHYLEGQVETESISATLRELGRHLDSERQALAGRKADIAGKLRDAAAGLHEAHAALDSLDLPNGARKSTACLSAGWERIGEKAVAALTACENATNDIPFHDLRKRAQDRWMHAALLRAAWPTGVIAVQNEAKALVDLLGHEHDLSLLAAHVTDAAKLGGVEDDRDIILLAIQEQRQKLQAEARKAGADVFDDRPGRDAAVVERLIRDKG